MKKIAIVTPFLAQGGLEKVALVEAEELSKLYDVTLIVLDSFIQDYPYEGKMIDMGVSLENRNIIKRIKNMLLTIYKLRAIKKKNNFKVVISHGELANIPNALSGGKNNILTIHGNRFSSYRDFQGKFVNKIIKKIYTKKNISKIVTVSKGIENSYIEKLQLNQKNIQTIYNPHNIEEIEKLSLESLNKYESLFKYDILINVGRLTTPKGQWYLLRIFSYLKTRNPNIKLVILGDGYLKNKLTKLSLDLKLKTYIEWKDDSYNEDYDVYFLGFQNNPFKFIKKSKLFVMTSLTEGLPNTIIESLACETSVISTDCKTGPREILSENTDYTEIINKPLYDKFGILMPIFKEKFLDDKVNLTQLEYLWAKTILDILDNKSLLKEYSKKAKDRAKEFELSLVINEWKKLIDSIKDKK